MKAVFLLLSSVLLILSLHGCCTPSEVIGSVNNRLRPQETRNWCWAATTQMIAENEGVILSQCDIANHGLGKSNCCDYENEGEPCPKTEDCNNPGYLQFDYAGLNFKETNSALSWLNLRKNIACKKNVLGYSYGTSGVVGHVVAVKGYVSIGGTNYVVLNDPWGPCNGSERLITYDAYADPPGTSTHWSTYYDIVKK